MRRVIQILLVLVVLVPSVARASTFYRCGMDGETRTACCCPQKKGHHKAPTNTELRSACCCKVTQLKSAESPVRAAPPASLDVAPAVVPTVIAVRLIESPMPSLFVDPTGSPRGPPEPLFVRHCALLL